MSDLTCNHCDAAFDSERERIQHVLDEHGDDINSHERDSLKRDLNKLETDDGAGSSLSIQDYAKPLAGVGAVVLLVGLAFASGIISVDTGAAESTTDADGDITPGAPGTTHEHAQFNVVVDGREIDFSQSRYQVGQTQNRYLHFEGGDGQTIHKHATDTTIAFALESLGMSLANGCLTLDTDEKYCEDEGNLTARANGGVVNASTYVIQDGDVIEVAFESG